MGSIKTWLCSNIIKSPHFIIINSTHWLLSYLCFVHQCFGTFCICLYVACFLISINPLNLNLVCLFLELVPSYHVIIALFHLFFLNAIDTEPSSASLYDRLISLFLALFVLINISLDFKYYFNSVKLHFETRVEIAKGTLCPASIEMKIEKEQADRG